MMKIPGKIRHKEAGMAVLQLVLLLAMISALLLPVILNLMGTTVKSGQLEERKTKEFYSADAGVTSGLYRVKEGGSKLPSWMVTNPNGNSQWLESTFAHNPPYESYTLSPGDPLNDNSVAYRIKPMWTLGEGTSMLETYNATQKRDPAVNIAVYGDYNGAGSVSGRGSYKIDIVYPGGDGTVKIGRIGCWLPAGLAYVAGSSSLEKTSTMAIKKVPVVSNYKGGYTITWDYPTPVDYNSFLEGQLSKASVTFEYTPGSEPQGEFSWVRTDKTSGVNYLAWDMKLKQYEVKSTATSPTGETTTASAYTYMEVGTQSFGATVEGDYWAFGNTLMRDAEGSSPHRERLYLSSNSTVSAIPSNATIKYIYLYWSGWKCKPWSGMGPSDNWTRRCEDYKVDKVNLKIAYPSGAAPLFTENITASQKRGAYDSDHGGWSYACFADITDRVKNAFAGTPGFVGNGQYSLGHSDVRSTASSTYRYRLYTWKDSHSSETYTNYTPYPLGSPRDGNASNTLYCEDAKSAAHCSAYPTYAYEASEDNWAYAAWSIIIIYSSPSTSGHVLRIYDTFQYIGESKTIPITFAGFSTPPLSAETNAARYTHFVGEGDAAYNESVTVKGLTGTVYTLSDSDNPSNNVCNNQCRIPPITDTNPGPLIDGIDIDTFNIPKTCIKPGDTEALVTFTTQTDSMNLIYMILSFRSMFTPGGISIYRLE
jgi:hypothetical protein